MTEIEELEYKIKELTKELNQLKLLKKQNKVKTKRWRAKKNGDYCFICNDGSICSSTDTFDKVDNFHYLTGNYFREMKQAENILEKIEIYMQLKDLALELNNGNKIRWDIIAQMKYCMYSYDEKKAILDKGTNLYRELGQIYCLDKNFLQKATEKIGKDNLNLLFDEEED